MSGLVQMVCIIAYFAIGSFLSGLHLGMVAGDYQNNNYANIPTMPTLIFTLVAMPFVWPLVAIYGLVVLAYCLSTYDDKTKVSSEVK